MKYIYEIRCLKNNKVYIGQTNNYKRRFQEHKRGLRLNNHSNKYLQQDYNKYGVDEFKFSCLECVPDDEANTVEDRYIELYGGLDNKNNYNLENSKGQATEVVYHHKQVMTGRYVPPEQCEKLSKALKGHIVTDETKLKISKSNCKQQPYIDIPLKTGKPRQV